LKTEGLSVNASTQEKFIKLWKRYFNGSELPITFYYTNEEGHAELVKAGSIPRCVIAAISTVREGNSLCFDATSIACFGGRRFLGFSTNMTTNFEYFLSCGIPGKLEGERYKKTPEIAAEWSKNLPKFKAPAKFVVFKRWDMLNEADNPDVVIFFAKFDVLAGLFTLANFDETDPNGVFSPFGSGCSSIVTYPFLEKDAARPRAVIGLFDPSARPFVPENTLSFAVPMGKFERMVANMEESFLITNSWKQVQERIQKSK
jgi:uncharacterized protein (DUF169 family)